MASITIQGNPVSTVGELPAVGSIAPDFELVGTDLAPVTSADFSGRRLVISVFPSVDTGVCAQSVREFNQRAASLEGTTVLCVSKDLPFAQARFCGAEGLDDVVTASGFRSSFGDDYGLAMADGPLAGLYSRAVIVVDGEGRVVHAQQVAEVSEEPDYEAAVAALGSSGGAADPR